MKWMAAIAATKAAMFAMIIISIWAIKYSLSAGLSNSLPSKPNIIGIDTIKLYSAAERGLSPIIRLAMMVEPERLTPGISAKAWANPTTSARRGLRCAPVSFGDFLGNLSTTIISTPTSASMIATVSGCSSTWLF